MKRNIFYIFLISCITGFSQVNENLLMERFNMNAFNPAFVGSEGRQVSFTSRSYWQGIAQAPSISYFFYSGNPKKNLSLGASVITNKVFIDRRTLYAVDASYQLSMGGESKLFLGIKAGATSKITDIESLERITNTANPAITNDGNAVFPVLGFGALFKTKAFFLSASIPNFLNPVNFVSDNALVGSEKPNTYLLAGTSFDVGVFGSKLKPFISTKLIPDGENQTHIGGTLDFKNFLEIGAGYKNIGFTNFLLMVKTKFGLSVAYAYEFGIPSGQAAVTRSGNELFIKFNF